jgi:hypothetical protein
VTIIYCGGSDIASPALSVDGEMDEKRFDWLID